MPPLAAAACATQAAISDTLAEVARSEDPEALRRGGAPAVLLLAAAEESRHCRFVEVQHAAPAHQRQVAPLGVGEQAARAHAITFFQVFRGTEARHDCDGET
jgi:hypothetical protein